MRIERQRELFAFTKFIREAAFSWKDNPEEFARRKKALDALHHMAAQLGVNTQTMYGKQDLSGGYLFSPKREAQREAMQRFIWDTGGPENVTQDEYGNKTPHGADEFPNEGSVFFMGGPGGSGKTTILNHPDIKRLIPDLSHFRWNADPYKNWMAYNNMIPSLDEALRALEAKGVSPEMTQKIYRALGGYASPMDMSPFAHEEASAAAKEGLDMLRAQGKSVIVDATMAGLGSTLKHLKKFRDAGYQGKFGILANAMLDTSNGRARSRYQGGDEAHRNGEPDEDWDLFFPGQTSPGGRFISEHHLNSNKSKMGGRSASEDTFRAVSPFLNGTLDTDARRDLKGGKRVLVSGGSGPMFTDYDWDMGISPDRDIFSAPGEIINPYARGGGDSVLIDPRTGTPFGKTGIKIHHYALYEMEGANGREEGERMDELEARRHAKRELLWEKLMEEYAAEKAGSVEDLVEQYGRGELDFESLVALLRKRFREVAVRKAQEEARMSPEQVAFERWEDAASGASGPDDASIVLRSAVRRGILTEEERRAILGVGGQNDEGSR